MKSFTKSLALTVGLLLSAPGFAQTPATTSAAKPATAASAPVAKNGAAMAKPAGSAATAAPATKAAKSENKMAAAAGGGDGKVWVNTASKTYHCAGTKYYGKTKAGEYMSEADAKAKGNHPDHKKACS